MCQAVSFVNVPRVTPGAALGGLESPGADSSSKGIRQQFFIHISLGHSGHVLSGPGVGTHMAAPARSAVPLACAVRGGSAPQEQKGAENSAAHLLASEYPCPSCSDTSPLSFCCSLHWGRTSDFSELCLSDPYTKCQKARNLLPWPSQSSLLLTSASVS